jgi:hypothetical protein
MITNKINVNISIPTFVALLICENKKIEEGIL